MRKARFAERQIIAVLKPAEAGRTAFLGDYPFAYDVATGFEKMIQGGAMPPFL